MESFESQGRKRSHPAAETTETHKICDWSLLLFDVAEKIFKDLDHPALMACLEVCRSWRDMARRVLEMKTDDQKSQALEWACRFGHPKYVEILLVSGADPNKEIDQRPCTSVDPIDEGFLPICIASAYGHAEVVDVLIGHGAEVDKQWDKQIHTLDKVCPAHLCHPDFCLLYDKAIGCVTQ